MIWIIIKNTFQFYMVIHLILSLLSLMICIDDVDHQQIMCPRTSASVKQIIIQLFKPLIPDTLDYLLSRITEQNHFVVNTLIFSGLLEAFIIPIYTFYYMLTQTPKTIQRILNILVKLFLLFLFISWLTLYFSGVGIDRILNLIHGVYHNSRNLEEYEQDFVGFINQRQQEIFDYYF